MQLWLSTGFAPAVPSGTPETVFTHSGSSNWYEVVQYSVKLVMDQRDIPKFCLFLGHELLAEEADDGNYRYLIRKLVP